MGAKKIKKIRLVNFLSPIFNYLKGIPMGRLVTYESVAKRCGLTSPRQVGWILKQNTEPEKIPCFRVVRADGRLAGGYKFGGRVGQMKRLRADGIKFDGVKVKNFYEIIWRA